MNKKAMTIDELSEKASELFKTKTTNLTSDKRYSENISTRRIRDYITKGLLDKPIKSGKYALFNELHLEQLLKIRELQYDGLTDKNIKKFSQEKTIPHENKKLQEDALETINFITKNEYHNHNLRSMMRTNSMSFQDKTLPLIGNAGPLMHSTGDPKVSMGAMGISQQINQDNFLNSNNSIESILKEHYKTTETENSITIKTKTWQEIQVDDLGEVFFKMENGKFPKEPEKIINNIKKILNI
jgi:DNA-binding transcriptional MerR regulator